MCFIHCKAYFDTVYMMFNIKDVRGIIMQSRNKIMSYFSGKAQTYNTTLTALFMPFDAQSNIIQI
jgi:hypothetical protein